jgi:hypothetical protein
MVNCPALPLEGKVQWTIRANLHGGSLCCKGTQETERTGWGQRLGFQTLGLAQPMKGSNSLILIFFFFSSAGN